MGLAKAIRKDRPWACPSKNRVPDKKGSKWCTGSTKGIPGSIVVKEGQDGKPGVVNMMAQYFPGKVNNFARSGKREDVVQREQLVKECLADMERRQPRFKQLAFPKEIGCGLAGGNWPTYKEMIMVFADRNRDIKIDIVEYYNIDDSESESANPSQGSDQDQPEDPNDRDEQGH